MLVSPFFIDRSPDESKMVRVKVFIKALLLSIGVCCWSMLIFNTIVRPAFQLTTNTGNDSSRLSKSVAFDSSVQTRLADVVNHQIDDPSPIGKTSTAANLTCGDLIQGTFISQSRRLALIQDNMICEGGTINWHGQLIQVDMVDEMGVNVTIDGQSIRWNCEPQIDTEQMQ